MGHQAGGGLRRRCLSLLLRCGHRFASGETCRWRGPWWPMGPAWDSRWGGAPAASHVSGCTSLLPSQFGLRCHRRAPGPASVSQGKAASAAERGRGHGQPEFRPGSSSGDPFSSDAPASQVCLCPAHSLTHMLFRMYICLKLSNSWRSKSCLAHTKIKLVRTIAKPRPDNCNTEKRVTGSETVSQEGPGVPSTCGRVVLPAPTPAPQPWPVTARSERLDPHCP